MKPFRIIKFKKKPFFQVKKLSKSFSKSNLVLNQIDFHVNRGEIFGILGPNGAGKTTIFGLILGLLSPDEGTISINGEVINTYPIYERCTKWKISYVPQNSACFLGLSTEQNLEALGEIKIKDKIKRKDKIQELLVKFNLENKKNTLARQLSGGEKKRLTIGMALIVKPDILLLDEPFSALDPLSVQTIREIIADLQKNSISSIISDHNISSTLMSIDRGILLANSIVVAEGRPRDLISNKKSIEIYFGKEFKI